MFLGQLVELIVLTILIFQAYKFHIDSCKDRSRDFGFIFGLQCLLSPQLELVQLLQLQRPRFDALYVPIELFDIFS